MVSCFTYGENLGLEHHSRLQSLGFMFMCFQSHSRRRVRSHSHVNFSGLGRFRASWHGSPAAASAAAATARCSNSRCCCQKPKSQEARKPNSQEAKNQEAKKPRSQNTKKPGSHEKPRKSQEASKPHQSKNKTLDPPPTLNPKPKNNGQAGRGGSPTELYSQKVPPLTGPLERV